MDYEDEQESSNSGLISGLVSLGVIILVIWGVAQLFGGNSDSQTSGYSGDYETEENIITSDEAISDYWDEIMEYVNGSETIEACSDSGCYELEADIGNGSVETIYFNNGGYLYFYSADFDSYGDASDSDDEGNSWEFTLDMQSSIVQDAVQDWADYNEYTLE